MKKYLIIANQSPFVDARVKESLDMALIFAALDQEVSLLLQGDAIYALKSAQSIDTLGIKNYLKAFGTLSLYDIEQIFVCRASLKLADIDPETLSYDVNVLDTSEKQSLVSQQTQVVTL